VRRARIVAISLLALGLSGCVTLGPRAPRPSTRVSSIRLHEHSLTLHLTVPTAPTCDLLLVYATGDGGWWGKDRALYNHLKDWGYASVGFSAREYVHHLGKETLRPQEVAADYEAIIRAAESSLGLPVSTRAVLIGKSRGAGLSVAAAGPGLLKPRLAGILVVGLTAEEEYVRRLRRARPRQLVMLETYSYLDRLATLPVAVIQSTRDNYIPADQARRLFGDDNPIRQLVAVEAEDHNFGGAIDRLYAEMERSLQWILDR
jgi:pimeloyl-ACP methyl ester carboxylesterase